MMQAFGRKNDPNSVNKAGPDKEPTPSPEPSKPAGGGKPAEGKSRFEVAIEYVLKNEGGFTDDARDPGGATQWGVIKTEYEKFLGKKLTSDDVRKMPLSTAKAIYMKEFWLPIKGDRYDTDAVAIAIMDTAVNKGLGGCMVCLRDALDKEDLSRYGEDTIEAVNMVEPNHFLQRFSEAVLRYIEARIAKYPNMAWARKGWQNRAKRLPGLLKGASK